MDAFFVLIRPRVWSPAVVTGARACLAHVGAVIDAADTVSASTLLCTSIVEKHFGGTHFWAAAATDTALRHPLAGPPHVAATAGEEDEAPAFCAAEEDLKTLFYECYGELWDAVLDAGRLRTAFDLMRTEGISASDLASLCASASDRGSGAVLSLPASITVTQLSGSSGTRLAAPPLYVVNGAYPAQLEAFLPGSRSGDDAAGACWWCAASWPSHLSRDEASEREASLRRALEGLTSGPHGIEVLTAPLEALVCRSRWMGVPLCDDPVARTLLQRGLPLAWVAALLRNPTLHERGRFADVFDVVAGKSAEEVAEALAVLWSTLRSGDDAAADSAAVLYDWEYGRVATPAAVASDESHRGAAVVLVHPRVWTRKDVLARVEAQMGPLGLAVEAVRDVSAEELQAKLDSHYSDVARYALDQEALHRLAVDEDSHIAAEATSAFQSTFRTSWDAAMEEGRIWSASLAEDLLGEDLAATLLRYCAAASHATHRLSASLAITEVSREALMTHVNPGCPVEALSPSRGAAGGRGGRGAAGEGRHPYSLTAASYFVVNATYAVYRRDVALASISAGVPEQAGGVWQVSWRGDGGDGAPPHGFAEWAAACDGLLSAAEEEWRHGDAAYADAVPAPVRAAYPLLQVSADAFSALQARHLWWGTSYEDDTLTRDLARTQGRSWLSIHPGLTAATTKTAVAVGAGGAARTEQQAVLALLPPVATTADAMELVRATLVESGVTIAEAADLFGGDAFEYVFGASTSLAMARQLAQASGAALWDMMVEDEAKASFVAAAAAVADDAAPPFSVESVYGGATVCAALRIPLSELEEGWRRVAPISVGANCWLGYLPRCEVWVVNGHIPLLEHRYTAEVAHVHLLRVQWDASVASWSEMQEALVGRAGGSEGSESRDGSSAAVATGSVPQMLARVAERSPLAAGRLGGEPMFILSGTAYHALIDVLRWPRGGAGGPLSSEVALENWLVRQPSVQRLVQHGVSTLSLVVQQVRETLASVLPPLLAPPHSSPTTPEWTSLYAAAQRAAEVHHGFLWLHPSSTTPAVRDAVPELLLAHRVRVRASGAVPLRVALEHELLDVVHDSLFKNAYVRRGAEVPITDAEAQLFERHFQQSWVNAVQLGLILNAREAEQRYGTVHVMTWWDGLAPEHQVRLSETLFVGYMDDEGLYVLNAPYSYRRARLHTGSHEVVWYAVEWDRADMSWARFLTDVVGAADPAEAATGSLRRHFGDHWTRYSLPGKPDEIECVLHASESPLAALAERCRWLAQGPKDDSYGRLLLQSGVSPLLLSALLDNPSVYSRDTGIITEAFHVLPQEDPCALTRQLRSDQCTRAILILPEGTRLVPPASAAVPPTPLATSPPREAEDAHEVQDVLSIAEQLRTYRHVALATATDPFVLCAFALAWRHAPHPPTTCSAVLYLDPAFMPGTASLPQRHQTLCRLVEQQLRASGVRVAHTRVVRCASAAEAAALYRCHHHREYRYGVSAPAVESLADSMQWQVRFKERFGVSYQHASVVLYNAAEMSQAMHISEREVAALWRRSKNRHPRDTAVVGEGCVVQRLQPGQPIYLVNGDVVEAEQKFVEAQTVAGVRAWLLTWDSAEVRMSYPALKHLVAELQAPSGVLRRCCGVAGGGSHDADDAVLMHVSESALAAVRQRQLWWQLPVWSDPVAATWTRGVADRAPLSARAVAWALQDPLLSDAARSEEDPVYLWDTAIGMDTGRAGARIRDCWAAAEDGGSDATSRNTAVVTLAPAVATNRAVQQLVRAVLVRSGVRIDAQGFIADHGEGAAALGRTVQYLYPQDWSYASSEPSEIELSADEADKVAQTFGTAWEALVDSGRLLPATRATKRLGGMTAPQLQLFVKAAKKSVWVRPHLHLVELEEYGVYVINAYVQHLAHTLASTAARCPLPYYVVSWEPSLWSWEEFLEQVVGCAEPARAAPTSIRGRLSASWVALGLHAAPERAEGGGGGVCASEGPLQGLLSRLHIQWPSLDSVEDDTLGGAVLQQPGAAAVTAVLRTWLGNPVVTCDGRRAGTLTHLAGWDTREVLRLAGAVAVAREETSEGGAQEVLPGALDEARREEHVAEERRAAEAAWETVYQQRYDLPPLLPPASPTATATGACPTERGEEAALLQRNTGTLLFFSHQLDAAQRGRLRTHLQQHGATVTAAAKYEEEEQECTAALLDRLCATEAFFADCHDLAAVLSSVDGAVAAADQARFNAVFRDAVPWAELVAQSTAQQLLEEEKTTAYWGRDRRRRVYSAADAMRVWALTPSELWTEIRRGVSMRLCDGLELTRLSAIRPGCAGAAEELHSDAPWRGNYVVNGAYAALRSSLRTAAAAAAAGFADGVEVASRVRTPPSITKWDVTWDAQTLSWYDLCQSIIGHGDCAHAAASSFNASLAVPAADAADATPSPLTCFGVLAASGPLAAFAVRRAWCWNADRHDTYLPDPFLRAVAAAGMDHDTVLSDGWQYNPVATVTAGAPRLHIFDWTRGCDTPQVLRWMDEQQRAASRVVAESSLADGSREVQQSADTVAPAAAAAVAAAPHDEPTTSRPPTPPPRMKAQLHSVWIRDALLYASTDADFQRLWQHYCSLSTPAAAASTSSGAASDTDGTISFAVFYRDFTCLDNFGVPNMSHELKQLFIDIEVQQRGRMSYAAFVHALALYHSL
ncbi:Flagellar Member 1 [Novymonas esmeraldas]|uniref:Flagellar Member 1 n=1 Tax=Novymonas esmeraldas TaxID=1808958 RepID=A0AAW0ESR7_9TRYP